MVTRKQYLDGYGGTRDEQSAQHRAYYQQFVDDRVRDLVTSEFTVERLVSSPNRDGAFNDIPLGRWDRLVSRLPQSTVSLLKEAGDYLTLGTGVCILKEAAQQVRETNQPTDEA